MATVRRVYVDVCVCACGGIVCVHVSVRECVCSVRSVTATNVCVYSAFAYKFTSFLKVNDRPTQAILWYGIFYLKIARAHTTQNTHTHKRTHQHGIQIHRLAHTHFVNRIAMASRGQFLPFSTQIILLA